MSDPSFLTTDNTQLVTGPNPALVIGPAGKYVISLKGEFAGAVVDARDTSIISLSRGGVGAS
jgi:hypothetical protein